MDDVLSKLHAAVDRSADVLADERRTRHEAIDRVFAAAHRDLDLVIDPNASADERRSWHAALDRSLESMPAGGDTADFNAFLGRLHDPA